MSPVISSAASKVNSFTQGTVTPADAEVRAGVGRAHAARVTRPHEERDVDDEQREAEGQPRRVVSTGARATQLITKRWIR